MYAVKQRLVTSIYDWNLSSVALNYLWNKKTYQGPTLYSYSSSVYATHRVLNIRFRGEISIKIRSASYSICQAKSSPISRWFKGNEPLSVNSGAVEILLRFNLYLHIQSNLTIPNENIVLSDFLIGPTTISMISPHTWENMI